MCTGLASARGVWEPIGSAARSKGPSASPISWQLLDHRPFHEHVGVPPVTFLASVAAPLAAGAGAARDTDEAVDDQDPAVVAVVDPIDRERA